MGLVDKIISENQPMIAPDDAVTRPAVCRRIAQLIARSAALPLLGLALGLGQGAAHAKSFYEDALQRHEAKDYDGAVIQLKNALKKESNKLAIQYQLGLALQQTGDVVGAEEAFNEALRLGISRSEVVVPLAQALIAQGRQRDMLVHPQLQVGGLAPPVQQRLLLVRASAWSDLGDGREALATIQQARAIDERRPESWLAEVPVRIRSRKLPEAMQAADRAVALAPQDPEAHYVRGSIFHVQGNLGGAKSNYDRALSLNPLHTESLIARAGLLIDQQDWAGATETLNQLKRAAPKEPRGAYLRALVAEQNQQPEQAKAALLEVTRLLDPVPVGFMRFRPQWLMLNGLAHHGLGQWGKAQQYLEALLKAQPDSPAVRVVAGIHLRQGKPDAAIPLLENYLRAHPNDGMALTLLGSANLAAGKTARASQLLQEAIQKEDRPEYRATLGMSLLRGGNREGARTELELAWRKDPNQVAAGAALAQLYAADNRLAQALVVARELVKRQPASPAWHTLLGDLLARSGQADAARQSYGQSLQLDPQQVTPKLQLARLDIQSNQLEQAEKQLTSLLRDAPKLTDAMAEMARLSERKGQAQEASRWLLRARDASDRKDLRWNLALMELNFRQGNLQQALEEGKLALGKQPDNLQALLLQARIQLGLGDTNGARANLNAATRYAEYRAPAQTEIAQLQWTAGNVEGAAYSLDKALNASPEYLPAMALMVQVELRQGQADKAEQRARGIVQAHPRRAAGHGLLGDIALSRNNMAAAVAAYRQAHKIEPTTTTTIALMGALSRNNASGEALEVGRQRLRQTPGDITVSMAMGDLHAQAGRYGDSAAAYRAVLKVRPNHVMALNSLANAQLKLKDPGARQTAEAAHKLAPTNPLVIDTLGWVLFQQGQTEAALPLLRDARLRSPDNAEIRYHLAKVLTATGRKGEAREELKEALRIANRFDGVEDAQILLKVLQ